MCIRTAILFLVMATQACGQWRQLPVATSASFRGLSAVGGNVVWASGTGGTVVRTVNGGQHWEVRVVRGAEKLDFRGVVAFDADHAVVMSSGNAEEGLARIYTTEDGGVSWNLALEEKTKGAFFDGMAFWDRDHGMVLSDPVGGRFLLWVTEDGGTTWKPLARETLPEALLGEGSFAASNSALVTQGEGEVWFVTGGAPVARLIHSSDRGKSWEVRETPVLPKNASTGIFSAVFEDARHGVLVGGDYAHATESLVPNLLVTSDSGRTWQPLPAENAPKVFLSSVTYKLAKHCAAPVGLLVAGPLGIYSVETGGAWKQESKESFNVIAQPEAGIAWAAGAKGLVAVARNLAN